MKGRKSSFIFGFIQCVAMTYVAWISHAYGLFAMDIVYVISQPIGWYLWGRQQDHTKLFCQGHAKNNVLTSLPKGSLEQVRFFRSVTSVIKKQRLMGIDGLERPLAASGHGGNTQSIKNLKIILLTY